jgi:glycosyltransferase involved in cell wall biosynthesis
MSNSTIPASDTVLSFNSATTLARTLESVKYFDQVLVIDSGSIDNTLAVAAAYGAAVHQRDWPGYAEQHDVFLSATQPQ